MKYFIIFGLSLILIQGFAQPKVGIEFGTYGFADRHKITYLDKTASLGACLGVQTAFPFPGRQLAFETGVLLNDNYYRLRGPHYSVWYTDQYGSGFSIQKNINNLSLSIPFTCVLTKWSLQPFLGAGLEYNFVKSEPVSVGLGSMAAGDPIFFEAKGEDMIKLSGFNWFLNAGLYWACSSHTRLKLQYSLGMNTYATHHISPKIINGVNEGGTTIQLTPIDRFQLGLVYTPDWKRKKEQVSTEEKKQDKKTMKEILKSIYQ